TQSEPCPSDRPRTVTGAWPKGRSLARVEQSDVDRARLGRLGSAERLALRNLDRRRVAPPTRPEAEARDALPPARARHPRGPPPPQGCEVWRQSYPETSPGSRKRKPLRTPQPPR